MGFALKSLVSVVFFAIAAQADWPANSCDACLIRDAQFKTAIAAITEPADNSDSCESLCDKKVSVMRPKQSTECVYKGVVIGSYPKKPVQDKREPDLLKKYNCGLWGQGPIFNSDLHTRADSNDECLSFCSRATLAEAVQGKRDLRCVYSGKEIAKFDDKMLWKDQCRLVESGGAPFRLLRVDDPRDCAKACDAAVTKFNSGGNQCKIALRCKLGEKTLKDLSTN